MLSTYSGCPRSDQETSSSELGDLVLRVRGGGYADDTVRLRDRKVTVGSDSTCTLQLREQGVAPLHCMIVRGDASTVVRCWDGQTELDGREFSDACLENGMCLQLGGVKLYISELHGGDGYESGAEPDDESHSGQASGVVASRDHCCPRCETQIIDLEARLTSIERQLDQLAASTHCALSLPADPKPDELAGSGTEMPAAPERSPATGLPLATLTEEAAYRACPVDSQNEPSPRANNAATGTTDVPSWAEAYQSDDVDDSVKDYVERLLQRVGNSSDKEGDEEVESPPAKTWPETPRAIVEESSILAAIMSDDDDPSPAPGVAVEPTDLPEEPYAPRSLPPEKLTSLAEMREVANVSAEAAIRMYEKNAATKSAVDRVPLMLVGLVCGVSLFYFGSAQGPGFTQVLLFAGAAVSILAGASAGGQALTALRGFLSSGSKKG